MAQTQKIPQVKALIPLHPRSPTNHTAATTENPRLTPLLLHYFQQYSSSSSFSSRLSRSFSLHSSPKKCAICLTSLKKGQGQAIFYAECSHAFHFNCIADNVKHGNLRCPVCRSKWKDVPFQAPKMSPVFNVVVQCMLMHLLTMHLMHLQFILSQITSQDDELVPDVSQEYPAVSASESFSKFGVLVRVLTPPLDNTLPHHRAPIDIVNVLDVSGSMASKLILLKRAVNFIIQNLGPSDRLSIVTFSSSARRILPLRTMSGSGREEAISGSGKGFGFWKNGVNIIQLQALSFYLMVVIHKVTIHLIDWNI
ncbi:hypothetical protein NC653_000031 [Populus alba x Populus x berolinensis]|uniref:Zinc finger family protein n=1 Tax=Populus alba x Populus x berolinensis TaxID=444605 RepID=A0AAD6RIW2_9ROSI|nr:hypothetical protein NC653_000031 [Populus alba x Populus x berolinensis]